MRRKILIEKRSKRSVMKEEDLHWETLQKMLAHSVPPGYRRTKKTERKIDAYRDWIAEVLKPDLQVRRLEADHGSSGTREYIKVLRLLEKSPLKQLKRAVEWALEMDCPRYELIAQHLYGEPREPEVFRLDGREHLKLVCVSCTDPGEYAALLGAASGKEMAR
ncbi:hypothetical protein N9C66_11525 [Akkermansiaceae bacterium]|nr:hypothetical protein [Akkermansiaceae bacterium]